MPYINNSNNSSAWKNFDVISMLSSAAQIIVPGSATDSGRLLPQLDTDHPDPIVLNGGIPDETVFPVDYLADVFTKIIKNNPSDSLMYGGWFGYEGCRNEIADRQNKLENISSLQPENIIMHNGSSGCMENICKTFLNTGDVVLVESPSFSGTVRTIQGYGAEVIAVPMTSEGANVEFIKDVITSLSKENKKIKLFYTIPDFHNPLGIVTSLHYRKEILSLCEKNQILVVEDAAYTEIYYDNPPPPSYYSLSDGYGVIKMSSFSKITVTGLRAGWIQARKELIEHLIKVRFDMGTSPLVHYVLADMISSGELDKHIEKMRSFYKEKCFALVESLKKHCSSYLNFDVPEGGFFLWLNSGSIPADQIVDVSRKEGLLFPPGSIFYTNSKEGQNEFRLAFTRESFVHLEETGLRLRKAIEKILD
ncbi:MAG: hypothetical protein CL782_06420 [Chloroflexi bacterium]|nr:hypothetical protein [Chloroflexota bacterium]|tara:strand:- start:262 stop:1524 length:1263 start_codon:yes stop_codon:yes gene_type:complete